MDICFEGVGQVAATFRMKVEDDKNVQAGMAVSMTGNGTVGLKDNGVLCGVLLSSVRGDAAAVQIGGVAKVSCSDGNPQVGWQELVCDGEGGVKIAAGGANGVKCLVLAVDEDGDKKSVVVRL